MSSAQLEVIFTDKAGAGAQPQQSPSAPGGSSAQPDRNPGPSDRIVGPKKPDNQGIGRDLENAAQKIANALGIGGLTGTAIELRRAFSRLYESVTAAESAVESKRRADIVGGGGSGDVKSPPAVKPVSPAPGIPNVGTFERQMAKGSIEGPPVSRAVSGPIPNIGWHERMTAAKGGAVAPPVGGGGVPAVPGVPVALPVVGPMAGAGTAASGMARLAAAAGPAALAVGAIAGAIAVGAVVIKKTFAAIDKETERLSGYSGALAGAQARAEIRQLGADMRRAQRIGPQLARARDFTSSVETKLADMTTGIMKAGLDIGEAFGSLRKDFTNDMSKFLKDLREATQDAAMIASGKTDKEIAELTRIRKATEEAAKLVKEAKELETLSDPFMDMFLDQFGGGMDRNDRRSAVRAARAWRS